MDPVIVAILVIVALAVVIVGFVLVIAVLSIFPTLVRARAAGVDMGPLQLWGMKLRRLDPAMIVDELIVLTKAGIDVTSDEAEAHVLAGGNLRHVVDAAVSAHKAGMDVNFETLCAIALAGRDVVKAIQACVNPVTIDIPPRGAPEISGIARDGIRVSARVRVTVRADMRRLVGGAGEATIVARVGEGIVTAIGHCTRHLDVLESPELITEYILSRGLDAGTAYEIVSVDVNDIDVHDNVRATLTSEQAESDKRVAQARAEMRRVAAIARGQEMQARVREMTAQVTANQANIPLAMAGACRDGHIWRSPRPLVAVTGDRLWDAGER